MTLKCTFLATSRLQPTEQSSSTKTCTHPQRVLPSSSRSTDLVSDSPMLSATSSNNHSLFSFGRNGKSGQAEQTTTTVNVHGSYNFLPSVSFDDLHTSIETASSDFNLTKFPSPSLESPGFDDSKMPEKTNATPNGSTTRVNLQSMTSRSGRSGSILHRPSAATRQPSNSSLVSSTSSSTDATSASVAVRARRQNHYPPVSHSSSSINSVATKPSRKSTGTSVLAETESTLMRTSSRRRPALMSERAPEATRASLDGGLELVRNGTSSQSCRTAKSSQASPIQSQSSLVSSSMLNLQQSSVAVNPKSPRSTVKPTTPSNGRRQSIAPGGHASHATGLGARTISPTDTRRLKRMSMMTPSSSLGQVNNVPPPPPPPPPPVSMDVRSASRSPSMIPRKLSGRSGSGTPSSSRTTPDVGRKSYSSGLSGGSTVSFNTVRTSTGSLQPRLTQSASQSRLPAPKHTAVHSSLPAEDDEDVPPVPAIPKAYESPRDSSAEANYADKKKSNISLLDNMSMYSSSTTSIAMSSHTETMKLQRKPSTRKICVAPTSIAAEEKKNKSQAKRKVESSRLPPLNLAPLPMPTSAKVVALQDQGAERNMSPPPSRQLPKTPTTPMTASKSSFFSKVGYDESMEMPSFRSSTSIHRSRITTTPPDASSSSESSLLLKDLDAKPMSPFLSSSVPKGSEFGGTLRRLKTGNDFTAAHGSMMHEERTPSKPSGPRPPHTDKMIPRSPPPPPMPPVEEAETPSSVSSLRRKLSVSWSKRSASKSGIIVPGDPMGNSGMKHDHMPTPRIPASATSTCLTNMKQDLSSTTSVNLTGGFLESRRRKSSNASMSNLISHDRTKSDTWNSKKEPTIDSTVPMPAVRSTSVVHRLMRPKSSGTGLPNAAPYTAELDKDDMLATEEMRKLGSRRKETEIAAKTLDALKKRATPKERVSCQDAIRIAMLNIYERGEIMEYDSVYFCGTQNAHKVVGDLQSDLPNFGYDDERGDYAIVLGDHIAYRYEIIDVLGKGSFGQVVRCIDHKLGILVAVKIIRNKKRFHQQALVEVKILEKLREWDPKNKHSMVNFTESFYFRGHLCISTELLDMNLYEFIKAHSFRGFSLRIIRRFTKQILSSLILLKQHKVIHCDLKPENILLRHPLQSEIKVIDFGSSCFESEKVYTYIQSRFYRSPEVILGMTYGMPIDMWSVGCILAELYTGVPIFPGENEQEQLACIMEVFGPPEKHLIEKSTRKKLFFDSMGKPRLTVSSKGRRRRPSSKTLQQVLKCDDDAFVDFLARCLRWDPDRRLKPEEAIRHEFITGIKAPVPVPRLPMRDRDSSPIKRHHTISVPRPLPDPPGASGKVSAFSSLRSGVSPHKPISGSSRRVSGVTAATTASINRRTSNGLAAMGLGNSSTISSGLPRVAGRSTSGRQDIATLGATAAMNRRS